MAQENSTFLIAAAILIGLLALASGMSQRAQQESRTPIIPYHYEFSIAPAAYDLAGHLTSLRSADELATPKDELDDARTTSYMLGRYLCWSRLRVYHGQLRRVDLGQKYIDSVLAHAEVEAALADAFGVSRLRLQGMAEATTVWVSQHERWRCMGFRDFIGTWKADEEFRSWFAPIVSHRERRDQGKGAEHVAGLGRVQHRLVRVMKILNSGEKPVMAPRVPDPLPDVEDCACRLLSTCTLGSDGDSEAAEKAK